jgi:hypothetical protein
MSLDDLRSDLAQVAPAKTDEDLDVFASELRLLLAGSESDRRKSGAVLDKKALWDRVAAEIDRHEEEASTENETPNLETTSLANARVDTRHVLADRPTPTSAPGAPDNSQTRG